jgi:hypothetical protein
MVATPLRIAFGGAATFNGDFLFRQDRTRRTAFATKLRDTHRTPTFAK